MEKFSHLDLYYFSGTGNTLRVAEKIRGVFERTNATVALRRMEKARPQGVRTDGLVGLAFPVACQGTYPFVWDFIRSLPKTTGTPIFMVDTLAAFSGGAVGVAKSIVEAKGYQPVGAAEIRMPSNFYPEKAPPDVVEAKVRAGEAAAEQFAYRLLGGTARWGRIPLVSDLVGLISQGPGVWKVMRRLNALTVDTARCTKCGLCAELCPVGDITMEGFPRHRGACVACMRCVSFCPAGAISYGKGAHERYRAVSAAALLRAS